MHRSAAIPRRRRRAARATRSAFSAFGVRRFDSGRFRGFANARISRRCLRILTLQRVSIPHEWPGLRRSKRQLPARVPSFRKVNVGSMVRGAIAPSCHFDFAITETVADSRRGHRSSQVSDAYRRARRLSPARRPHFGVGTSSPMPTQSALCQAALYALRFILVFHRSLVSRGLYSSLPHSPPESHRLNITC